ncbi:enoyl-CoA hydratase [Nevskia soli]|uniref:enoyl-CoA hydratase n=1 Tax=Nevskia soli TaxID=418856 RepID=UPI0004A74E07|nr:enoyl-CoA hydratase [Nevskia soli]
MSEHIKTEIKERILTIRFNRADKKNAITQDMYLSLIETLTNAATDGEVRVVLLAGAPDAFSAGNDMQDFLSKPPKDDRAPVGNFMRTLAGFPKPVIAAVNGIAIGIGVTVLLHCDLVYLGQNARLQLPFVNIGLCPEFASSYLLPRMIGNVRASELILTGAPFTAEQAMQMGLVNAVLPEAEVEAHASSMAEKLALQPPNAIRVAKKLMRGWTESTFEEALKVEFEKMVPMLNLPEAQEAINAFMQKRKSDFSSFS